MSDQIHACIHVHVHVHVCSLIFGVTVVVCMNVMGSIPTCTIYNVHVHLRM